MSPPIAQDVDTCMNNMMITESVSGPMCGFFAFLSRPIFLCGLICLHENSMAGRRLSDAFFRHGNQFPEIEKSTTSMGRWMSQPPCMTYWARNRGEPQALETKQTHIARDRRFGHFLKGRSLKGRCNIRVCVPVCVCVCSCVCVCVCPSSPPLTPPILWG